MAPLPTTNWKLDHIGHAVADLSAAVSLYTSTLGFTIEETEELTEEGITIAFLRSDTTLIELLAPLSNASSNSPIAKFIRKRGEGLHHICYEVVDIAKELIRLEQSGVQLIDSVPRPGSRNTEIAFIHPKSTHGCLIELCSKIKP